MHNAHLLSKMSGARNPLRRPGPEQILSRVVRTKQTIQDADVTRGHTYARSRRAWLRADDLDGMVSSRDIGILNRCFVQRSVRICSGPGRLSGYGPLISNKQGALCIATTRNASPSIAQASRISRAECRTLSSIRKHRLQLVRELLMTRSTSEVGLLLQAR